MSAIIMEADDGESCLTFKGRDLVRKYTDELPGQDQLEIAVQSPLPTQQWALSDADNISKRKERDQLRQLFQRSDSEETYHDAETERKRLLNAWRQFQEGLPEQEQRVSGWFKRKGGGVKGEITQQLKDLPVTTFEDVEQTIETCKESWLKKDRILGGKAQNAFHKACKTLHNHAGIFEFFPSQNEYVSVLCGSLKMLVQASITHVETAEEFSKALKLVADELEIVMLEGWIMDVERTRRHISELYAKVFKFLRFAMVWWTSGGWRKIKHSLGRGILEDLQGQIQSIRSSCDILFRTAQTLNLVETRHNTQTLDDIYLGVSKLDRRDSHLHKLSDANLRLSEANQLLSKENERLRQKQDEQERYNAEMNAAWKSDQAKIGANMKSALLDMFFDAIHEDGRNASQQRAVKVLIETNTVGALPEPDMGNRIVVENNASIKEWFLDDALQNTRHFEQYIIGAWRPSNSRPLRNISNEFAISKLEQWSSMPVSQLLWMIGPPEHSLPSNVSAAAAGMFATAVKLKIPLISHFCALPPFGENHREEAAMIGLAYSLIRQLLAQLPPIIETGLDLSAERLAKIDGTVESWEEALSLLKDLFSLFPKPLLVCVIDGLSRLDFRGGSQMCKSFIQILMDHQDNQAQDTSGSGSFTGNEGENQGKLFKILLTSSGDSAGLNQIVPMRDRLKVDITDATPRRDLSQRLSKHLLP